MVATASCLPRNLRDYGDLLGSILACEAVGAVGAAFTGRSVATWYPTLRKPSFNPPDWLFGPVWTALYLLMGVSFYLTRKAGARGGDTDLALKLFTLQLVLNSLWTLIFFRLRSPRWAFLEIVLLWAAIALTIRAVYKVSRLAALLLLPYLLWTSFAAALNLSIWRLNT